MLVLVLTAYIGADFALSDVFANGGEGGIDLAKEVVRLCEEEKGDFTFSYELDGTIEEKIEAVVKKIYGGDGVIFTDDAKKQIKNIKICFATAYNRYGEGKPWKQGRVLQFFAEDELLISSAFWNMVCKSSRGYEIVLDEYRKNAHLIIEALAKIKKAYLPDFV